MNIEQFREFCIAKPGVSEDFPFGEEILVFRVGGKIFALTSVTDSRFTVNLKCDPEWAIDLREHHEEVQPGYHMNKKHWNTVDFEGDLDVSLLRELVNHSYELVRDSLPKKLRENLQ
jgi:predicted DNA-binding protein (MmcQ/YjbR family)